MTRRSGWSHLGSEAHNGSLLTVDLHILPPGSFRVLHSTVGVRASLGSPFPCSPSSLPLLAPCLLLSRPSFQGIVGKLMCVGLGNRVVSFWLHRIVSGILVPPPGVEPGPSAESTESQPLDCQETPWGTDLIPTKSQEWNHILLLCFLALIPCLFFFFQLFSLTLYKMFSQKGSLGDARG